MVKKLIDKISFFLERKNLVKKLENLILIIFGVYVFSLPTFSDIKPWNYFVYIIFFILSVLIVFYALAKKVNLRNRYIYIYLCFFVVILLGTFLFSKSFRLLLTVFLISISYSLFFIFFSLCTDKKKVISCIVVSLFVFSVVFGFYYKREIILCLKGSILRIGLDEHFTSINSVASYFLYEFFLALYITLFYKNKLKYICILPIMSSLVFGLLLASRSFMILVVLSSLSLFIAKFIKKPIVLSCSLIALGFIVFAFFKLQFFGGIKERLFSFSNLVTGDGPSNDYSSITRILWQKYAFNLFLSNPVFGYGVDGFSVYSGVGTYCHSNIFELLCDAGLIGFVFYYIMWVLPFRNYNSLKYENKCLIICLLLVMLVKGFFTVDYYFKINAVLLSFIVSLSCKDKTSKIFLSLNI